MTIDYSDIIRSVRKRISVLAKRSFGKTGEGMYPIVSFSGEEEETVSGFVSEGVSSGVSSILSGIKGYVTGVGSIDIEFDSSRRTDDFENAFKDAFVRYVEAYSLNEYLSLVQSPLSQRYQAETTRALEGLRETVFFKGEPDKSSSDYGDITGRVRNVQG